MNDSTGKNQAAEQASEALNAAIHRALETERLLKETALSTGAQITDLHKRLGSLTEQVRRHTNDAAAAMDSLQKLVISGQSMLGQVEEFNRKANSESGYAFNAKVNAEEHAKVISQARGTVEVDVAAISASRANADGHTQVIAQARGFAEATAQEIASIREKAAREAETINSSSERAAASMPAIEKGADDANAISAAKSSAEASTAAIQTLQSQASEAAAKAAADAASVGKADQACVALVAAMSDARAKADEMNANLDSHEQSIKKMLGEYSEVRAKIEGLLPGATSAGLAAAFHAQKERFLKPQRNWLILFVLAIAALLSASFFGLPASSESWDAILRHLVNRLPLVAPLIWLAIYSGHHYNMALRMQEEYAFKEAVSRAFEGYKREMEGIDASSEDQERPLVTLCENVLQALAERPGRIYEGKTDVATPATPILNALKDLTDVIGRKSGGAAESSK